MGYRLPHLMEKTLQFLLPPSLLTIATFSTFEVNYHAP